MNPSLRRFAVPVAFLLALGFFTVPTAGFATPAGSGLHWPNWLGFLSNLWAPTGCSIDPVGGCGNASTPAPRDQGCMVDPVGRCTNAGTPILLDQGCGLDPVGRCTNANTPAPRDEGCGVDPVGRCAN